MNEIPFDLDLPLRLRRLRQSSAMRRLVRETEVRPSDLIQPLFVVEEADESGPIESMPGQHRLTIERLVDLCAQLYAGGIAAVALFPKLDASLKTPLGEEALNEGTLILRAIRAVKQACPELLVITDVALDPYTRHGHDGLLNAAGTDVENDATVEVLMQMAVLNAQAGADFVAPSDMMDGRVGAIREALDRAGFTETCIMAYSAKFSSAYYGPFRDAVGSAKALGTQLRNKDTYQLDPANRRMAALETMLDEVEGADVLMVKPAGPYLDIIRELRNRTAMPVAAYQVSGEYAQIHAAARLGWLDLTRARDENLLAIKRAGADMILTYFAKDLIAPGA